MFISKFSRGLFSILGCLFVSLSLFSQGIIIDHTCTDLSIIPNYWIQRAKEMLRVSYGHTSHGSQPITGMYVLKSIYGGIYDFRTDGSIEAGKLSLADQIPPGDLGNPDRVTWAYQTREYLNSSGSDRNVVIWSWCGQASNATQADIDTYLNLMSKLEADFQNVTFVYMTGHLDGTGEIGNLNVRNNQIRNYVRRNNKVLFDFADIESYDPDGKYFLNRGANDNCDYQGGNWAIEWCSAHPGSPLCASCNCAHSQPLNCNLKARAFWWLMARLAGWGQNRVNPIDCDLDANGIINEEDFILKRKMIFLELQNWIKEYWAPRKPSADVNRDGIIGRNDIAIMRSKLLEELGDWARACGFRKK